MIAAALIAGAGGLLLVLSVVGMPRMRAGEPKRAATVKPIPQQAPVFYCGSLPNSSNFSATTPTNPLVTYRPLTATTYQVTIVYRIYLACMSVNTPSNPVNCTATIKTCTSYSSTSGGAVANLASQTTTAPGTCGATDYYNVTPTIPNIPLGGKGAAMFFFNDKLSGFQSTLSPCSITAQGDKVNFAVPAS